MSELAVGALAAVFIAGIVVIRLSFDAPSRSIRLPGWLGPRLLIGMLAGAALGVISKVYAVILIVPVAVLVLPRVFGRADDSELRRLEALDRWVRLLAASGGTGKSLVEAIRSTAGNAPDELGGGVIRLLRRLDDGVDLRSGLVAFADEVESADADAVIASLILIGERGGTGASVTLQALGDQLRDRLQAFRQIAVEREKPRIVVRQVSVITLVVIIGAIIVSPAYFAPFATAIGQVAAVSLALAYLGCLAMLSRMTAPRARARIVRAR